MKIQLLEAKGLIKTDFQNPEVWDYLEKKDYQGAIENSQQQDLEPIITKWIFDNAPAFDINNEDIVNLVTRWFLAYKTFDNPFFDYMKKVNELNIKPNYNGMVAINNKYAQNIINDKDLKGDNELIFNQALYNNRDTVEDLDYIIDIYTFFNDEKELNEILNSIPNDKVLTFKDSKGHKFSAERDVLKDKLLYYILFDGGNPKSDLRTADLIEETIDEISQYVDYSNRSSNKKKKTQYNDKDKVAQFIRDNQELFRDTDFVDDLLLALEKR